MVFEFKNNDTAYLKWLIENPSGFVLNTRRRGDSNYIVLHKASCHTVNVYPSMNNDAGGFTEKSYIKICANTIDELHVWANANGRENGTFSKICGICYPQGK